MNVIRPRLLVTRPEPGATKTADRLRALGFDVETLPLTRIVAVEPAPDAVARASDANIVAVTSANALRHAPESLLGSLRSKPVHAVGEATAAAARQAGFAHVLVGGGDASHLANDLLQRGHNGGHIAFLCGCRRVSTLEDTLVAAGITVTVLPVYDTQLVSQLTVFDRDRFQPTFAGVLLHAQSAAQALAQLPTADRNALVSEKTLFFAISERVADALPSEWRSRTIVADAPDDTAMSKAVLSLYGSA